MGIRAVHRHQERGDAAVFEHVGVRPGQQEPVGRRAARPEDQTFCPFTAQLHAVAEPPGSPSPARSGPGARFAEEWQAQQIGAQEWRKELIPLSVGMPNIAIAGATSPVVTLMAQSRAERRNCLLDPSSRSEQAGRPAPRARGERQGPVAGIETGLAVGG